MLTNISIIQRVLPQFEPIQLTTSFSELGIESIDLMTLRVAFENQIQQSIPDSAWLSFDNCNDIIFYCNALSTNKSHLATNVNRDIYTKSIDIDMPQMAIEGLSENWLLKEFGNIHWEMIGKGLQTNSFDLKDDHNNRLYATFVRISISLSNSLFTFKENQRLHITGNMNRFGEGIYYSNIHLHAPSETIHAQLMSSFSIRDGINNTKLSKSQPKPGKNSINSLKENPEFGETYRALKKNNLDTFQVNQFTFQVKKSILFSTLYQLNPYYDINGVGLLYFASYPIISDYCEQQYLNSILPFRYETSYYTLHREIFYFANCNIHDAITYHLHAFEYLENDMIQTSSTLIRNSDQKVMAKIFTIKKRK
jgi:probable biosynthetic protein (TIGR04098 family)